jgi:hypothetical protein
MTALVDTSVFLLMLLKQPGAFTDWLAWHAVAASELLKVKARPILDRLRLQARNWRPQRACGLDVQATP